jgi:ATP/maltotriose-dependent transcriptional regulator MalT
VNACLLLISNIFSVIFPPIWLPSINMCETVLPCQVPRGHRLARLFGCVANLSPTLQLILATRTDPELPLAQLRVRGHLLEIRDRNLRFTREEAASFLKEGMDQPLSAKDVTTRSERTEGWIAGLQLAALSLRKYEDPSPFVKDFAGSHRFVLDYVQQDQSFELGAALA